MRRPKRAQNLSLNRGSQLGHTAMSKELKKITLGIVINEDKVLIIQRSKEEKGSNNAKLSWVFPGGKIEKGESPEQAIIREVMEETGYEVRPLNIISERQYPQFPVHVYYLTCKLRLNKVRSNLSSGEIKKVKWVELSELKDYLTTNLDKKVAEYLKNRL